MRRLYLDTAVGCTNLLAGVGMAALSSEGMTAPFRSDPRFSRETTIRRDENGRWYHDGVEIEKAAIVHAFNRWIDRAEDGRYCLKNEVNWAYVEIEGAPVVVRGLSIEEDHVTLELSDGRCEALLVATLRQSVDGRLYCDVRDGRLTAQFSSNALSDLAPLLEEAPHGTLLRAEGSLWPIPMELRPIH